MSWLDMLQEKEGEGRNGGPIYEIDHEGLEVHIAPTNAASDRATGETVYIKVSYADHEGSTLSGGVFMSPDKAMALGMALMKMAIHEARQR